MRQNIKVRNEKNMIKGIIGFIKYNKEKEMTIKAYIYAAFFRMCILALKKQKLEKMLGERGQETPLEETEENYKVARMVARHVNRIANHTLWESKCLVRAMTAQKLLKEKNIHTTLYLGVGKNEEGGMRAHAWLRCGKYYVTGEGECGCAMVAKFKR